MVRHFTALAEQYYVAELTIPLFGYTLNLLRRFLNRYINILVLICSTIVGFGSDLSVRRIVFVVVSVF